MKRLTQSVFFKQNKIKQTAAVISFLFCLYGLPYSAAAQVRTSMMGAMNALNSGSVASTAPVSPAVAAVTSPTVIPVSSSGAGTPAGITAASGALTPSDMINARDVSISYQSAYSWWSGYQDYRNAAAGLSFNADGSQVQLGDYGIYLPVSPELRSAVNFFMEDTHFTLFRDFGTRKVSLIIRGNQPIPVELMPDAGGYVTYTPELTSFKTTVPLNLK